MAADGAPAAKAARVCAAEFDASRRQVFVIGNEAADVDSLVSAYAMAALLDTSDVQAIAVAQIPREEFRLRGDALSLFGRAGCSIGADGAPTGLRFWDDVDWAAVKELDRRGVVLTDHNKMTPKVADVFEGRVEWIIDHHADASMHPEARRDMDGSVGSACTLVAEQFFQRQASRLDGGGLGTLLAGVVVLDCRNFDAKEAKGTPRDRAALDQLQSHIPEHGLDIWYKELSDARADVSHLSVKELLLLDMKAASVEGFPGSVAFCAMFGSLDDLCEKAGGAEAMFGIFRDFAQEKGYEAVVANFAKDAAGLKALALVPREAARADLCAAVEARVLGAPGNLPKELRDNPLYAVQGILTDGFGLSPRPDLAPLRAFGMRAQITRKTMLPRAMSAAVIEPAAL